MSERNFRGLFLVAAAVLSSSAAFGQVEIQMHVRRQPGWDVRAREGHCDIHVWVDQRAEVRLRGDNVFVKTVEGSKARDEGSECSQPLPFNAIRDFQIRQIGGRTPVELSQQPSRMNNYTALMSIYDPKGGGDSYTFEASWHADADTSAAAAPFFDDVRACQEMVRQRFLGQNGRGGAYVDFDSFAQRKGQDQTRGQESIQGQGYARRSNETRALSYSCVVDTRRNQVVSSAYQYSGGATRTQDRPADRGQLR